MARMDLTPNPAERSSDDAEAHALNLFPDIPADESPTAVFAPVRVEQAAKEVEPQQACDRELPGSEGEHLLQLTYGSRKRATQFYRDQVCARLNDEMVAFVQRMPSPGAPLSRPAARARFDLVLVDGRPHARKRGHEDAARQWRRNRNERELKVFRASGREQNAFCHELPDDPPPPNWSETADPEIRLGGGRPSELPVTAASVRVNSQNPKFA